MPRRSRARGGASGRDDLLIAAIAAQHGAALWSLDSDFDRMAALGFLTLHPGA